MYQSFEFPYGVNPYLVLSQYKGTAAWLNSNDSDQHSLIALGINKELKLEKPRNSFEQLRTFYDLHGGWMFGYLSYDLKNDIESLQSENRDLHQFPVMHFFQPCVIIETDKNTTRLTVLNNENETEWKILIGKSKGDFKMKSKINSVFSIDAIEKIEYLSNFEKLLAHIQRGDIYEVNYCIDFEVKDIEIDPLLLYYNLSLETKAPFSVFYRSEGKYLLSGSPERYLKKEGNKLISQPIKGTIKRGADKKEDENLKKKLFNDPKERSENVMIVDIVRNDLSRVASKGSVKVDELFGVYTFRTVHHLVSTISCTLKNRIHPVDAIKATFPMGSMTGAPKISAMKLIEKHEDFRRGMYSGAFGYFSPNGDFDFNVIIRSIIYNENLKTLSFPVGGAITSGASGEQEYKECLLKAEGMKKAIQKS